MMQKIFYCGLAYSFFLIIITSCVSPLRSIKNKFIFDEKFSINDIEILKKIDEYSDLYINRAKLSLIIICSKENLRNKKVTEYYISNINQDSYLFNNPCSGSFVYKNKIILVYSSKIGYINPVNYPVKFLKKARKSLNEDWNLYKEHCNDDFYTLKSVILTGTDQINKVKNGVTTEIKHFDLWNYCYGEKRFRYTNYVNLDNFRTIYVEDCND